MKKILVTLLCLMGAVLARTHAANAYPTDIDGLALCMQAVVLGVGEEMIIDKRDEADKDTFSHSVCFDELIYPISPFNAYALRRSYVSFFYNQRYCYECRIVAVIVYFTDAPVFHEPRFVRYIFYRRPWPV